MIPRLSFTLGAILLSVAPSSPAAADPCSQLVRALRSLPPELRARGEGETSEAWRRRVVVAVETEATLAAEAAVLDLDQGTRWQETFTRRRSALLLGAIEETFATGVEVTSAEVERWYQTDGERFSQPEKIATSFILLALPPDAEPAQVEAATRRLLDIRREHTAGAPFGALARRYSEAENAPRGGAVAARPRGGLLAAYEEVAWSLRPGEVSEPFRLPDGLAIVRLEHIYPAQRLTLEEARPRIEKRLALEKTRARRQAALVEAGARWPAVVDWPQGIGAPAVVRFAGRTLDLDDLGLAQRPPRLQARLAAELDRRRLLLLAEQRGLDRRPATADALADLRRTLLAAAALERRVQLLVDQPGEAELRALYEANAGRFVAAERRVFEVLFLPGEEGALRGVRDEAERLAELWRQRPDPRAEGLPEPEIWGPLKRAELGASTSPRLAAIAFSLGPGEVSQPVRLESYDTGTARYEAEGYVVLRLASLEPKTVLPFDAVREELSAIAGRDARAAARRAARDGVARSLDVEPLLRRASGCTLEAPPPGGVESRRRDPMPRSF